MLGWIASTDNLSWLANVVTIIGLPLATLGLVAVAFQMRNDRLAVSSGAIGEMRTSIMHRVDRLHEAQKSGNLDAWESEFRELANDLEMACAIYLDGQMAGRTGKLAKSLVIDFLDMINDEADLRAEFEKLVHAKDTFQNIRDFRKKVRTR